MTNKKIKPLKQFVQFHRAHLSVTAVVWLFFIVISFVFLWPTQHADVLDFVALSGVAGGLAITLLSQYECALAKRMEASGGGPEWKVQVNDVTVGSINDAAYARIRHAVFFDVRTYVSQLMNFGNIASRMIDYLFLSIPVVVFWFSVVCYFFWPTTFAEVLDAIGKITPAEASAKLPMIATLLGTLAVLAVASHAMLGRSFGFINRFDEECNKRLRSLFECPFEGKVTLFRFVEGSRIQSREMDTIRKQRIIP